MASRPACDPGAADGRDRRVVPGAAGRPLLIDARSERDGPDDHRPLQPARWRGAGHRRGPRITGRAAHRDVGVVDQPAAAVAWYDGASIGAASRFSSSLGPAPWSSLACRVEPKTVQRGLPSSLEYTVGAADFDNSLTTTPVDGRGSGDTQRTIWRIQLSVRLHSSVGRAADS